MRLLTTLVLASLLAGTLPAQEFPEPFADAHVNPQRISQPTLAASKNSTLAAEVHAAAIDLYRLNQAQIALQSGGYLTSEIRYFSLYAVPPELREIVRNQLFFWVNSLSRGGKIYKPEPVPNTGGLLYRVHLSNYSWTPSAWEALSAGDPFFRLPFVSKRDYDYMRYTAGNAIVRADWFLEFTSDTNESQAYYTLLYANALVKRGGKQINLNGTPPANAVEFQEAWGVDLNQLKNFAGLDKGAIVPDGTSIVAFHNRILWRVPTVLGYYWQTFDIKDPNGFGDFTENRFPIKWDASEYITSMPNGLQAYLLSDGNGKRVEFADPFVARDRDNTRHSVLVRTSQSCVFCHRTGILPARNLLEEVVEGGVELMVQTKHRQLREEQFYLNGTGAKIRADQYPYAVAVQECNGLTAQENAAQFLRAINYYRDQVTLKQAARECGTTTQQLQAALSWGTKGDLALMSTHGRAISRKKWDARLFAEAMLLLQSYQNAK